MIQKAIRVISVPGPHQAERGRRPPPGTPRKAGATLRRGVWLPLLSAAWLLMAIDAPAQTNGVLRQLYANLSGGSLPNLTNSPSYPNSPTDEFIESSFEAPNNFADYYGQRMRAMLAPPVTGTYVFWIASDDNSVLYLSTDDTPARKVAIASVATWTAWREWNKEANQQSAPIQLTNGQRYYIEAIQADGTGGDNLSVTWRKPGDAVPANGSDAIPGTYLVPYGLGRPIIVTQPKNATNVEATVASFSVQLSSKLGATFQWRRNNADIPGATNPVYSLGSLTLSDSGARFSCFIANSYGTTNSDSAVLTVLPDMTRPALESVSNLGDPRLLTVIFSEPMELATSLDPRHYTISGGVMVESVAAGPDSRTFLLITTPMLDTNSYTLTVNNVRDRAESPNSILPNSQLSFSLASRPLDVSLVKLASETIGPSSRRSPIILSELMYHPAERGDGRDLEFVEVFNSNPHAEDISGFRLSGEVDFTFPPNTVLAGKGYLVVAATPADVKTVYMLTTVLGPYTNRLSNSRGTVRLRNRQDGVIFEVNYSDDPPWPAGADGAGHSLVLARPSLGERNPAAWGISELFGGSPGRAEVAQSHPYRTVLINEFLAHTDDPELDYIELYNYSVSPVDLSGCVLTDDPATNKFIIPTNTIIAAQGFAYWDQNILGFRLGAAGQTLYFKDRLDLRVVDAVRYGPQANGVAMGRTPDGSRAFSRLLDKTPGRPNAAQLVSDIVINELMYAPVGDDERDQFVELFNRSSASVHLGGWRLEDGISYTVPVGVSIAEGGYLVIAKDVARCLTNYPTLAGGRVVGDFAGSLARGGERVALTMPEELVSTNATGQLVTNLVHIVVDEVTYGVGGRWGRTAHAGGSSLELVDARADHRLAPNWADSDESARSGWITVEQTGMLDHGSVSPDALQVILLGPGECLVDNVEVVQSGSANLITNPGFDSGMAGWVVQGNHEDSAWESQTGYGGGGCLHVRATERGDTGANRIRTTLSRALDTGVTATLRARVRWLAGNPEILLRLKGNWLEATTNLLTTRAFGTPGARNSRARDNLGPAITDVTHFSAVPPAYQTITVAARVNDPDNLASLLLKWRRDPSTDLKVTPMVNNGAGLYSATIPGQPGGSSVAFHIQAIDNASPRSSSLFPADAPARECLIRWGDPPTSSSHGIYRLWMTQATLDRWSKRERLSNKSLDCTFVYGNSRVVYNMGARYSGSPWHAPGYDSPVGNVCDYLITFPEDAMLLGETEATLQWPGNGGGDNTYQREQTAYWLAERMNLPWCNRRSVNFFVNGVRRAELLEDAQQPNADFVEQYYPEKDDGDLHKIQLWFEFDDVASTFNANGAYFQNLTTTGGRKKLEWYRWTFAKRAVRGSASNYTNFFALAEAVTLNSSGQNYRRQLEAVADIDNWLKTYAIEHIVGNTDSFAYGGGQNMYTFKPLGGTWKMFIWDIDFAFAAAEPASDVFQGIGRSCGIDFAEAPYLRRYWEILYDLANGPLVASTIDPVLDAKYNAMVASGRTVDNPATIKSYVSQRRTYLLSQIASRAASAFSVTTTTLTTNRNLITLSGTAPLNVRSLTIDGLSVPLTWTSTSNWTAQVVLSPGLASRTLRGLDAAGNPVAGATATLNLNFTGVADPPENKLVINEIMYHPAVPDTAFVELHNASTNTAFELSSWRLEGADFSFPAGSILAPGTFALIVDDPSAFAQTYGGTLPILGAFQGNLQNSGETLRLVKPGGTPALDQIIDEVRYEPDLPWPSAADGGGASLQLIDPAQDNRRVGNWAATATNAPAAPAWRYFSYTGTATSSSLYIYLSAAGDAYVDDMKLVAGAVAEAGPNLLPNGDFESTFPGPWTVAPIYANSDLSTAVKRSGNRSLHIVGSSGGSTRGSSIYQDISPALTVGAIYTLSFWARDGASVNTLTLRFSGSSPWINVPLQPPVAPSLSTPGRVNSVRTNLSAFPALWLNEVAPFNLDGPTDRFGHRHPWLELYNSGTNSLSLDGLFLANQYTNLLQWRFPQGVSMASNSFRLVWLDGIPGESTASEIHSALTLPTNSGTLLLVSTNGGRTNILDYLNFTLPPPNRSYGHVPDGSGVKRRALYFATPASNNRADPAPLTVVINEWMADNSGAASDPADGHAEDWFEIYNPGPETAYLSGFYLGTALTNWSKYRIPDGYSIPAGGRLLVWADEETSQNATNRADLHANFKLAKQGEGIGIFTPEGAIIDFITFGPMDEDVSGGRFPDGGEVVQQLTMPTPRTPNYLEQSNSAPSLEPLADRVLIEGQLLAFTVTATDNGLPWQKLTFNLDSGASAGAFINPDTGYFSWRPSSSQTGTWSLTVRVTDDGSPPLSATGTFLVHVAPRPSIGSLVPDPAGGWAMTVPAIPGQTYRIEYKTALADPEWLPLGPDLVATADSFSITDDFTGQQARFYRVLVIQR